MISRAINQCATESLILTGVPHRNGGNMDWLVSTGRCYRDLRFSPLSEKGDRPNRSVVDTRKQNAALCSGQLAADPVGVRLKQCAIEQPHHVDEVLRVTATDRWLAGHASVDSVDFRL